jgi:hypothetical protein
METQRELLDKANAAFLARWKEDLSLPKIDRFPVVKKVLMDDPNAICGVLMTLLVDGKEINLTSEFGSGPDDSRCDFTKAEELRVFANEFFAFFDNEFLPEHGHDDQSWDHLPQG